MRKKGSSLPINEGIPPPASEEPPHLPLPVPVTSPPSPSFRPIVLTSSPSLLSLGSTPAPSISGPPSVPVPVPVVPAPAIPPPSAPPPSIPLPTTPKPLPSREPNNQKPVAIIQEIEDWLATSISTKVKLDVGGRRFTTSVGTVQNSRSENSKLAEIVAAKRVDEDGYIFIDRDPDRFVHVLNWLRDNKIPALSANERRALKDEAIYFGLTTLVSALDRANISDVLWPLSQEQLTDMLLLHEERDSSGRKFYSKLDLSFFDLSGLCFRALDLRGVNFRHSNLRSVDLVNCNLAGAVLTNADLTYANCDGSDFTGAQLSSANLSWTSIQNTNLSRSVLRNSDLSHATITNSDLTEAVLVNCNLISTNLSSSKLSGCQLASANLTGANLTSAVLSSNVPTSHLSNSSLASAVFANSNLSNTIFKETIGIMDCEFRGATISNGTSFVNVKSHAQWGNLQVEAKTLLQMGAKLVP